MTSRDLSANASKLWQLIEARDPDLLPAIVHLARSLDDPRVVDALLDGVTYEKRRLNLGRHGERMPRKAHHHARMAMLALVATQIGERATALHPKIRRLELANGERDRFGNREAHDPLTPVDLALLDSLPLRIVRLSGVPLRHPERLAAMQLETLVVDGIDAEHLRGATELRTLMAMLKDVVPTLPACEELQINALGSLRVEPQPALLTFTTWTSGSVRLCSAPVMHRAEMARASELVTDEPMPALRHLHCAGEIRSPEHMTALEDLRTQSMRGVVDLPALRRLELEGSIDSLAELRGIELEVFRGPDRRLVTLEGYPRAAGAPHRKLPRLRSLRGVGAMRGVETLELRSLASLAGIDEARGSLRGLDIRECREIRDVSVLATLDLRAILVAGTDLQTEAFPEHLRWAVVHDRDASVVELAMRERPT